MEKYENLGLVGEGSYGMVLKCKHKESGQLVAIKKFLESEDDKTVKKIAMREIRMLKQLRHENLVNLIEVFRRKKRLYLVFEFVDHTVLDDLERFPNGLDDNSVRRVLWQVLKGTEFCHLHNIIHRDIKPENILVSKSGIVKLCDFGFARTLAQPGEAYTDYVATRWYRAPELLVGDTKYGRAVDIWAIGCLTAEMLTGEPLFPGDSDIDQLYHIVKCFGNLTARQREIFHKNNLFVGMRLPEVREVEPLEKKFPKTNALPLDLMKQCLRLDASDRPTCSQLLRHEFFTHDSFAQKFPQEIKSRIQKENNENPLLRNVSKNQEDNKKKDSGGKKKKPKERRESKSDDVEEKPKRKLPDPEKFAKKPTPPASNNSNLLATPVKNNTISPSPAPQDLSESPRLLNASPTGSMPPIQSGGRVNDKMKKGTVPAHHFKKSQAPVHHSTALTSQPTLQTERTSLHEKKFEFKKRQPTRENELPKLDPRKDKVAGLSFPEVKGAEANPNRNKGTKKGYMPHITNIDPFNDSQTNESSPLSPDKDSNNLPSV